MSATLGEAPPLTSVAGGARVNLWVRDTIETLAALFLIADLIVVVVAVTSRYCFGTTLIWSDDVARALMLATSFFGATAALARGDNVGIVFFIERLPAPTRRLVEATVALIVVATTAAFFANSYILSRNTFAYTVGVGLPQSIFFVPMTVAAAAMTYFALVQLGRHRTADLIVGATLVLVAVGGWATFAHLYEDAGANTLPLVLIAFFLSLVGGMPIGFVLAFAALIYVWTTGLPGEIFSQQVARGIDNFVLLAVPFFILVGYLAESNGMSVRMIALLQRMVGRMRGGLNLVMVLGMIVFSGISGSKIADVAAVGTVMIPAARKSRQNPGEAVALLASSAIMAETIPPSIPLIILGFVANVSIGGLFVAGLVPAAVMMTAIAVMAVLLGSRAPVVTIADGQSRRSLLGGGLVVLGLLVVIFGGYRSGLATATEASALAALYALVVGAVAFRETDLRSAFQVFKISAVRAGMVMFIVAAAQSFAYTLTLQRVPHVLADAMLGFSAEFGTWMFMLLSIAILIVMGAVLEGAAALIIFAPLLMPVAKQLGFDPLHYGIVLVISMGIGLFAPPLGLGLYASCMIGGVRMEDTIRPMLKYLGLIMICVLVIAYFPWFSTALPRAMGY